MNSSTTCGVYDEQMGVCMYRREKVAQAGDMTNKQSRQSLVKSSSEAKTYFVWHRVFDGLFLAGPHSSVPDAKHPG
jgi:hypothetical protein